MKKAFIQKLSIAMASALVITSAAPVAQADAAAKMKMNRSSKILYLNEDNSTDTSDTYDFSIKNKPAKYASKYSFTWYAEDDSIVDVAKGGVVTAVKVGKTTVKCDIIKKSTGKVYQTVKATVEVKANAETVVITNTPADGKMTVGTTWDFNRTMKAANGGKATDKTEWKLYANEELTEESKIATVDSKGIVTAVDAGTFYVVARTYQSKATKETTTATSEAFKVTVPVQMTDVKLTKAKEVQLTFDSSVKDLVKANSDVEIYSQTTNKIKYPISSVKVSDDGKTVTVASYQNFTNDTTYSVKAAGSTKEFTAKIGTIASIVMENKVVQISNGTKNINEIGAYKVYDAYGVDITTDYSVSGTSLAVLSSYNNGSRIDADGKMWLFNNGDSVTVQLKYFKYNSTTGADESILSNTATITASNNVATATSQWAIASNSNTGYPYGTTTQTVNAEDNTKRIFVIFKDNFGNDLSSTDATIVDKFSFESYDPNILVVDRNGYLYPKKAGTVTVKVTYGDYVDYLTITVREKANLGSLVLSTNSHSLSNSEYLATRDSITVTVKLKDVYGDQFTGAAGEKATVDVRQECPGVLISNTAPEFNASGETTITFYVKEDAVINNTTGSGYYVINYGGKSSAFQVSLKTQGGAVGYRLDMSNTLDNMPNSWETYKGSTEVKLWDVDANGVLVSEATGANISYVVKKADGSVLVDNNNYKYEGDLEFGHSFTLSAYQEVKDSSGNITAKKDLINPGTYTVEFYNTTNGVKYLIKTQTVTVTSSKKVATVAAKEVVIDAYTGQLVNTLLTSNFNYFLNGNQQYGGYSDVEFTYNIVDRDYISGASTAVNGTVTGGSVVYTNGTTAKTEVRINVTNVKFTVDNVRYSVDLNQPITFKEKK